jgi:D-alanyl-D-alanine carboxypeptidase
LDPRPQKTQEGGVANTKNSSAFFPGGSPEVVLDSAGEGPGPERATRGSRGKVKRKLLRFLLGAMVLPLVLGAHSEALGAQESKKNQPTSSTQAQANKTSAQKKRTTSKKSSSSSTSIAKVSSSTPSTEQAQRKTTIVKGQGLTTQSTSTTRSSSRIGGNALQKLPPYKAAIVMDAASGEILASHDPHKQLVPASLTKMMLVLIVMEKIRAGRLRLSEPVVATEWTTGVGGTQVDLKPGEVLPLEELLQAIMVRSANDAAATVAEHVAGSQARFVDMMNLKARTLGMKNTHFVNVHGLPGPNGLDNISTAYDMAILARALLKYPEVLRWSSQEVAYIRGGRYPIHSTNKLLGQCEGVDGLKTGFVRKAGFNIAATASRDGKRVIAVVMGSPSSDVRNRVTADLISWALGGGNGERRTAAFSKESGSQRPSSRRTRLSVGRGGS